ncbi:uncharacterized protein Z520_09988 [Fonsecaea multimorphosa CBS 102226]|uniref:Uncharacterized protein n=1 Tax=Fonsecaea multimorphosa CBS 102226 TaxID=1442371 RepID=A0A0D2KC38_9EURO|nr:uncharacterized protein Z520_09988 [Fonsecaea multimorphosa CBS 102226]KIX94278.1 hypothetical protein Z520_09988 [Fonsecaea multimorphosa CBS 102226]OAL19958.1 hypothetical protein AYO22_09485 [Fonsecaea multimorphosa]
MAAALVPTASVYQGVWTDWSEGKIWGLTLTLCPTHATILTNALAVFVTVCGIQLWNIIRSSIDRFGTPSQPEMLTPQLRRQKTVLRNADSGPITTAERLLYIAWKYRRTSTGKPSLRAYSFGMFAIIFAILSWAAGIFSNRAISTGSTNGPWQVLSRSNRCGVWNQTYFNIVNGVDLSTEDNFDEIIQYTAKRGQDVQLSFEYAQQCYFAQSPTDTMSSTCNTFKTSSLDRTVANGTCPFQIQSCLEGSNAIVLETDQIDSHVDLGINAKPKDRLKYSRRTTCAVLDGTDHIKGWNGTIVNSSSPRPAPDTAYAYYGPSLYKGTEWTYAYSNFASFFDNFSAQVTLPYQLDSEMAFAIADPQYSTSDFQPIEQLVRYDADVSLLFLSYTGMYLGEVDDPWFSAHNGAWFGSSFPFYLQTRYARDLVISTLGCTEQYKFCTNDGVCTDFLGFDQVQNVAAFNAALTPHQNATFNRILFALSTSNLRSLVQELALTTNPLLASNETYSGDSGAWVSKALPEYQWKLELEFYYAITMAHLQRTIFEWATGSIAPTPAPQDVEYILRPTLEQDVWFCNNMILQSTVYQSFSLVVIILIVIFGTLILITATFMSRCSTELDDDDVLEDGISLRPEPSPRGNISQSRRSDLLEAFELTYMEPVPNGQRVSSATLPPEDRGFSILSYQENFGSSQIRPEAPPRLSGDSWMAISLNEDGALAPEAPRQTKCCDLGEPQLLPPPAAHLAVSSAEHPMNGP